MRDLILKMSISIDGFVSDLDGANTWMFGSDPEAKAWVVETISSAGLHIMGSRTFRDMAAYWPTATDMFAPPMNQIRKVVFSRRSLVLDDACGDTGTQRTAVLQPGAQSWSEAYVASGDLAQEIATLKGQEGKPIVAHGGAGFARSLVAHELVDQLALLVHPVALGKGLPLFSQLAAPMRFDLVSSRSFPGGAVAQVYRPA